MDNAEYQSIDSADRIHMPSAIKHEEDEKTQWLGFYLFIMIIKQAGMVQVRVKLNLEYKRKLCGFLLVQFRAGVGDFDV